MKADKSITRTDYRSVVKSGLESDFADDTATLSAVVDLLDRVSDPAEKDLKDQDVVYVAVLATYNGYDRPQELKIAVRNNGPEQRQEG